MMSSDILSSRSSQELLLYLKVHTQINFQGFFLDKSLFNFQGATHSFRECLNTISHRSSIVNTFFAFFIRFFQLLRVFCERMDFVVVLMHCYGSSVLLRLVFYWGWCFIGLLVYYSFITIPLVLLFLLFSVACGVLVWELSQGRCGHRPLQVVWWYRAFSSRKRRGRVDDDSCCFSDSRKGCPYDLFFQFVADDAHIVQKSYISLFACGESVRRDAEPYGF